MICRRTTRESAGSFSVKLKAHARATNGPGLVNITFARLGPVGLVAALVPDLPNAVDVVSDIAWNLGKVKSNTHLEILGVPHLRCRPAVKPPRQYLPQGHLPIENLPVWLKFGVRPMCAPFWALLGHWPRSTPS